MIYQTVQRLASNGAKIIALKGVDVANLNWVYPGEASPECNFSSFYYYKEEPDGRASVLGDFVCVKDQKAFVSTLQKTYGFIPVLWAFSRRGQPCLINPVNLIAIKALSNGHTGPQTITARFCALAKRFGLAPTAPEKRILVFKGQTYACQNLTFSPEIDILWSPSCEAVFRKKTPHLLPANG